MQMAVAGLRAILRVAGTLAQGHECRRQRLWVSSKSSKAMW